VASAAPYAAPWPTTSGATIKKRTDERHGGGGRRQTERGRGMYIFGKCMVYLRGTWRHVAFVPMMGGAREACELIMSQVAKSRSSHKPNTVSSYHISRPQRLLRNYKHRCNRPITMELHGCSSLIRRVLDKLLLQYVPTRSKKSRLFVFA